MGGRIQGDNATWHCHTGGLGLGGQNSWTQPSMQGAGQVGNSAPTPPQPLSSQASWVGVYILLSAIICFLGVQALHTGVGELTDYVYFLLEKK